jgi:lambda repressor-like predicted transcriptional regulator
MCLVGHSLKNTDMASRTNTKQLRGQLLIKGYTLREFAKRHGFSERTVKAAMRRERHGPKSQAILEAIRNVS